MANTSRRITIELEAGDPVHGTLAADDATGTRAFSGWVSLLAALADAVEVPQAATDSRTDAGSGIRPKRNVPSSS